MFAGVEGSFDGGVEGDSVDDEADGELEGEDGEEDPVVACGPTGEECGTDQKEHAECADQQPQLHFASGVLAEGVAGVYGARHEDGEQVSGG